MVTDDRDCEDLCRRLPISSHPQADCLPEEAFEEFEFSPGKAMFPKEDGHALFPFLFAVLGQREQVISEILDNILDVTDVIHRDILVDPDDHFLLEFLSSHGVVSSSRMARTFCS
jgi:hypothetical protein